MVLALKILLSLLTVAFVILDAIVIREYKRFRGESEETNTSLFDRIIIGALAFCGIGVITFMALFFVAVIFSQVTIVTPFIN